MSCQAPRLSPGVVQLDNVVGDLLGVVQRDRRDAELILDDKGRLLLLVLCDLSAVDRLLRILGARVDRRDAP